MKKLTYFEHFYIISIMTFALTFIIKGINQTQGLISFLCLLGVLYIGFLMSISIRWLLLDVKETIIKQSNLSSAEKETHYKILTEARFNLFSMGFEMKKELAEQGNYIGVSHKEMKISQSFFKTLLMK